MDSITVKYMTAGRYAIPSLATGHWHESMLVERRSRFIARTAHAPDPESARRVIESIRTRWPDASHHCFAFVAGPPGNTARIGYSDDGEPHGSAGRPMLNVLLHSAVGEIVCVVTRYFGGVKLGVGGLLRAYQGAVQHNVRTLPLTERVSRICLYALMAYAHVDRMRRLLPIFEARCTEESYGIDAAFIIDVPEERAKDFIRALHEATDGAALVESVITQSTK